MTIFVFLFPCPFFFPFRFTGKRQTPKEVKLGRGGGRGDVKLVHGFDKYLPQMLLF